MHALIVVAHHDPQSLTHGLAAQVAAGLSASGHSFEIADLAAEGFDPRYTAADQRVHRT
ncbi:NAD(P)H-dependent oxidoreductase, partial [Pseudomonas sp. TNT11]